MEEVLNVEEAQALGRTETVDDRFDVARFNSGDVERKRSTFFIGRVGRRMGMLGNGMEDALGRRLGRERRRLDEGRADSRRR